MKNESNNKLPLVLYELRTNLLNFNEREKQITDESGNVITMYVYDSFRVSKSMAYDSIVTAIIRDKYTEADELAMDRQSYAKAEDYKAYNAYCEQAKAWACEALGKTYTPLYEPTNVEILTQLRTLVSGTVEELPDEQAQNVPALYEPWKSGEDYVADNRRYNSFDGKLYKCVQAHHSQADWRPDLVPALWAKVSTEEWPEWVQPTGAQDAYSNGDKCSHNGKHWISNVDANVWEPGVYGWTESV